MFRLLRSDRPLILMFATVFAVGWMLVLTTNAADAQDMPAGEPATLTQEVGITDQMATDSQGRPVWHVQDQPDLRDGTLRRCTDSSCSTIEAQLLTDLAVVEVLADGDTIVLIGEVFEGASADEPQFAVRRCADGPAGICDPTTSQEHRVTRSALGRNYRPIQAVLDSNGHPIVLAEDNSVVNCDDPLCTSLAGPAVQAFGFDQNTETQFSQRLLATPDGMAFVALSLASFDTGTSSVVTVQCRDAQCVSRNVNRHDRAALGLPPSNRPVFVLDGAVPSGDGARPLLVISDRVVDRVVDCRSFVCSAPLTNALNLEGAAEAIAFNGLGNLVVLGEGYLTLCADDRCLSPQSTEPVAPGAISFSTRRPVALSITADDRPVVLSGDALVVCGAVACPRPAETGLVRFDRIECGVDAFGQPDRAFFWIFYANLSDDEAVFEMRTGGLLRSETVPGRQTAEGLNFGEIVTGRSDGPLVVAVSVDGVEIESRAIAVACEAPPTPTVRTSCMSSGGRIDVQVAAALPDTPATYSVQVGQISRTVTLSSDPSDNALNRFEDDYRIGLATVSSRPDGSYSVVVTDEATSAEVYRQTTVVDCGGDMPPTPSTASVIVSCLQGRGRIDTTIVERSEEDALWSVDVRGLSVRESMVKAGDWWRMPVTGRPDGFYSVQLRRNGIDFASRTAEVRCGSEDPLVSGEVTVTNACRDGLGYLLFQFVNQGADPTSWVLEFDGVPNRSTSAAGAATSVRAVTGRPDGTYNWAVRGGQSGQVVVDC